MFMLMKINQKLPTERVKAFNEHMFMLMKINQKLPSFHCNEDNKTVTKGGFTFLKD